jgi:hypothetical protein
MTSSPPTFFVLLPLLIMVMSPRLTLALPWLVSSDDIIVSDTDLHFFIEGIDGLNF